MADTENKISRWKQLHITIRIAIILAGVMIAYTLIGFFLVPPVAKSVAVSQIEKNLGRKAAIEEVYFNPYTFFLRVRGFDLLEPDSQDSFVSFKELDLNMATLSLFKLALVVQDFQLTKPYLHLVIKKDGSFNFSDIAAGEAEPAEPETPPDEPATPEDEKSLFPFLVDNMDINNGEIKVEDHIRDKVHTVADLNLHLPFSSSLPEHRDEDLSPSLGFVLNGTPVFLKGETRPFSKTLRTEFNINIEQTDLTEYWAYVPAPESLNLASGIFEFSGSLVFELSDQILPHLFLAGTMNLTDLALDGAGGARPLAFRALSVDLKSFHLLRRTIEFGRIELLDPAVEVAHLSDGSIDLTRYLPREEEGARPEPAPSPADREQSPPFAVTAEEFSLRGGAVRFSDKAVPGGFAKTIAPIDLRVTGFSNREGEATNIDLAVGPPEGEQNGERFSVKGSVVMADTSADLAVTADGIDVTEYAPYYAEALPLDLLSALAAAQSTLKYAPGDNPGGGLMRLEGTGLRVENVVLAEPDKADQPALALAKLEVRGGLVDLLAREASVASVAIDSPRLRVTREENGEIDPVKLFLAGEPQGSLPAEGNADQSEEETAPAPPAADQESPAPFAVTAGELVVNNAVVNFSDLAAPGGFSKTIAPINLRVADFSNREGEATGIDLAIGPPEGDRNGERFTVKGSVVVAGTSADLAFAADGIDATEYAPYYAEALPLDLLSAVISASADLAYAPGDDPDGGVMRLEEAGLNVENVALAEPGKRDKPALTLAGLAVKGGQVDLLAKEATVASVVLEKPHLRVAREANGDIDPVKLFLAPDGGAENAGQTAPAEENPGEPATQGGEWKAQVAAIELAGLGVEFTDKAAPGPVALEVKDGRIAVKDLRYPVEKLETELEAALASGGTLKLTADIGLPFTAKGNISLDKLAVEAFAGYLPKDLPALERGLASLNGSWSLGSLEPLQSGYSGSASLERLRLSYPGKESKRGPVLELGSFKADGLKVAALPVALSAKALTLDSFDMKEASGGQLMGFTTLALEAPDISTKENSIEVESIRLDAPRAHLTVDKEGNFNLVQALEAISPPPAEESAGKAPEPEQAEGKPTSLAIGKAEVSGGVISISNANLPATYTTEITDLKASLNNFAVPGEKRSDFDVTAGLFGQGSLDIEGVFTPAGDEVSPDFAIHLRNVELPNLSPFTLKYLAYPISKGKLRGDAAITITGTKIKGSNKFVFSRLELGKKEKVEGASNVPIQLALALLTSPNGDLVVDVPISGNLDDPDFSVTSMIFAAIINIFAKIATAPFALLGSLVPDGQNMNIIPYEPGSATLGAESAQRLDSLAQALTERPNLEVAVMGYVDERADREAMVQAAFMAKLKAAKFREIEGEDNAPASAAEVTVGQDEYQEYLELAYEEEPVEGKPENFLGILEDVPVEFMELKLHENIEVTDNDLLSLARQRARAVYNYLVLQKDIEGRRIYQERPESPLAPPSEAGAPATRAELVIK